MTCPPDPPTDGYLLGPRCLGSKWVLMSAGAISHSGLWLNWSDPIDIDSVTFKAITLSKRWTSHHCSNTDSWLATNYKREELKTSLGEGGVEGGRGGGIRRRQGERAESGKVEWVAKKEERVGGESNTQMLMQPVGTGTALQPFTERRMDPKARGWKEQWRRILTAGSLKQSKAGRKNLHLKSAGEEQTAGPNHSRAVKVPSGGARQNGLAAAPALLGIMGLVTMEKSPGKQKAAAVNWQPQWSSTALPAPALTGHPPSVPSPHCLRFPIRRLGDQERHWSRQHLPTAVSHWYPTHKTLPKLKRKLSFCNPATRFNHGPCIFSGLS